MRKIILLFLIAFSAVSVSAQAVRLRATGSGKVSVTRGKLRSVIDLTADVSGCAFSGRRGSRNADCAASPADFKLVDAIVKNNQTFVVVQTDAAGNCNVCGRCGASESFTLIWLKLDARLRVLEKKAVPIESCDESLSIVSAELDFNEETQDATLNLKFKGDRITIEFEKTIFNDSSEISGYEFSHLEYDRKTPEKGFMIKTEKREKSSMKEQ